MDVVAHNSHDESDLIPETAPALGRGLILQTEIAFFRRSRRGLDVIAGEILPAYVESVREEDGRLNISFRIPGGKGKAQGLALDILERLKEAEGGRLDVGDKSAPDRIDDEFPGASKSAFKKAVSALYKKGLVQPGPHSISLMKK